MAVVEIAGKQIQVKDVIKENISKENLILIGFVTSRDFCVEVLDMCEEEFFKNKYARVIFKWTRDYYKKYGQPIGRNIEFYYEESKKDKKFSDSAIIESFLQILSEQHESEHFNLRYYVETAKIYFKTRFIEIAAQKTLYYLDKEDLVQAELSLTQYKNPICDTNLDTFVMDGLYYRKRMVEDPTIHNLIKFPGALGDIVGHLRRAWSVVIQAPMKRGKSFSLFDWAGYFYFNKLKVALFSLEMNQYDLDIRWWKLITGSLNHTDRQEVLLYPCFDCVKNQLGTCNMSARVNRVTLKDNIKDFVEFEDAPTGYRPCTSCRYEDPKEFDVSTWWYEYRPDILKVSHSKKIQQLASMGAGTKGFYLKALPKFQASFTDIQNELNLLEAKYGFVPDVVIIDYADILAPEDKRNPNKLEREIETWNVMTRYPQIKNNLLLTASQGNRGSTKKDSFEEEDTQGTITKLQAVDVAVAINNQTPEERLRGAVRMSVLEHRHKESSPETQVLTLRQLATSQVCLDSVRVRYYKKVYVYLGG